MYLAGKNEIKFAVKIEDLQQKIFKIVHFYRFKLKDYKIFNNL